MCVCVKERDREREIAVGGRKFISISSLIFTIIKAFDSHVISVFILNWLKIRKKGFPGGAVVKNLPVNAGDTGSSPGLGRFCMLRSN